MKHYWSWFVLSFLILFAIPEFTALARRRPQDTLSWWVWTRFQVVRGQPLRDWSASHFLFAGGFLVFVVWLTGHFVARRWT